MKKAHIAFAALPVLCGAAGFAGGQFMLSGSAADHATPALTSAAEETFEHGRRNAAEQVLDSLAETAMTAPSDEDGSHRLDTPGHAEKAAHRRAEDHTASLLRKDPLGDGSVVRLGRVSVPVYHPDSVTYVVSEVGVAMRDTATAQAFNVAENASRLRDVILASMHDAAGTSTMQGPDIDTEKLTRALVSDLQADFGDGVTDVMFLSMVKANVPRS
ncbi:hypothetical protein GGQ68_003441 [Sagittula marina]|uniref:Flagellar protein FliL n=1 Tax=Sagittula marina TaxID=943940 RepID=A0A7W6GTI0_9RHOB|nr:hypothetical protein [Sagittula marina]MBB3987095.1 hypothetical protein [Sagittula marina]